MYIIVLYPIVPEDQPAPTTTQLQARSVHLTWVAPSTPNGQLVQFNIIQNGVELTNTNPDTFTATVAVLSPFTLYTFAIEACTAVGCFRSDEVSITTLEDGKRIHRLMKLHVSISVHSYVMILSLI